MRRTVCLLMILSVFILPVIAGAVVASDDRVDSIDFSGVWKGKCLLSSLEVHVYQEGDHLRGVAFVHSGGETNPYHFEGELKDGVIKASHAKGHVFTSTMLSRDMVEGKVKTGESGYILPLKAKRVSDIPVEE